jgi:hypothetical protein
VLITWAPPSGVYVTNLLSRSSAGLWTPAWTGAGSAAGDATLRGSYVRTGDTVVVRAIMIHGTTSNTGTNLRIGNLPFPIRTTNTYVHGYGHFWSTATRFPLVAIGADGANYVELWAPQQFGGSFPFLSAAGTGVPFAWTVNCEANLTMVYDTDG